MVVVEEQFIDKLVLETGKEESQVAGSSSSWPRQDDKSDRKSESTALPKAKEKASRTKSWPAVLKLKMEAK